MSRQLKVATITFLGLVLFDALIGGAISTILRIDGWIGLDQRLNDVYHLNYAIVIAGALAWFYSRFKQIKTLLGLAALFLGYVEDTLFYVFIPLVNPIIKFLTTGESFRNASGELFPEQISGWIGWLGRMFLGGNIAIDLQRVFVINAAAVALAVFLAFYMRQKNSGARAAR
ncbi:hypothetical protein L0337_07180 [candidate division KSB1 bacterium]|nr:hypothetical protein [candidate division KSB1 bacterium]